MLKKFLFFILLLVSGTVRGQVVYEDINNASVYEFLDELANMKVITLNSAVKPLSRACIAEKLREALAADDLAAANPGGKAPRLNKRQRKELNFYLQDYQFEKVARHDHGDSLRLADNYRYKLGFLAPKQRDMAVALNPPGFHYRDSLFTLSIRPILGFNWMTNEHASEYHRWWGGSVFGYVGKNFGFYANLRDNNESVPMATTEYFTTQQGAVYKYSLSGAVYFSEMRGGVNASVKWGSVGIMVDHIAWGDNYHGANIISGKAPAFPYLMVHLNPVKWFDFNYMYGWLNSNVTDSSRSYQTPDFYRQVSFNKYIAASMVTFIPWRGLYLSVGNSVIYSDARVNPVYMVPFFFFNTLHATKTSLTNNSGSNPQLFFNFSSRQIRHLHLFMSIFLDDWKLSRFTAKDQYNFTSFKAGARLSNFPVQNLSVTAEYTHTTPMTYDHFLSTTTFASNGYSIGNYLRGNSQEIFLSLSFHPVRGLQVSTSYTVVKHGDEPPYLSGAGNSVYQVPFIKNLAWQGHALEVSLKYEFVSNGFFLVRYENSNNSGDAYYQPDFLAGRTNTVSLGINIGF